MNQIQIHTLTMFEAALATATQNPPSPPPSDFPIIIAALAETIAQAKAAAVTQTEDRGMSSSALREARRQLFTKHLIPIRTIAVGRLSTLPNVRRLFRIPGRTVNRITLIQEATIIADNAAAHQATFIASGLPSDFIGRLQAAITAVSQAGTVRTATRGDQLQATQALKSTLKHGQQLVHALNGIMQYAFAEDPATLAVWNSARRVPYTKATEPPKTASLSRRHPPSLPIPSTTPIPATYPLPSTVRYLMRQPRFSHLDYVTSAILPHTTPDASPRPRRPPLGDCPS